MQSVQIKPQHMQALHNVLFVFLILPLMSVFKHVPNIPYARQ